MTIIWILLNLFHTIICPKRYYGGVKYELMILMQSIPENYVYQFKVYFLNFYIEHCKETNKRFKLQD